MSLNPRQQAFVSAYLANGGNGKQAAISAGYSPKGAEVTASKLLRVPKVHAEVAKVQASALRKAELSAADVFLAIKEGIDFDPARAFAPTGALLSVPDMPLEVRRNLRGFKVVRIPGRDDAAELVEVKWSPRTEWTGQGARVLGLNRDKTEIEVSDRLSDLLSEATRRARGGK